MQFVERDEIYSVNVPITLRLVLYSVTLETEVSAVNHLHVIEVHVDDTAATFNAADSVTFAISEGADAAGLKLERAFDNVAGVELTSRGGFQVPDVDHLL